MKRKGCRLLSVALLFMVSSCAQVQTCKTCTQTRYPVNDYPPLLLTMNNLSGNSPFRHIYLEGDGSAWFKGKRPSKNPNAKKALALTLFHQDDNNAVYLQRPCYGYRNKPPAPCTGYDWTFGRYSTKVVRAMNHALDQLQHDHGTKSLVLIGHSGGGSLAMLLANRRSDVQGVITLAANLDHKRWTEAKGYLPLTSSLNVADDAVLPTPVFRWHFAGAKDKQVPADLIRQVASEDPHAQFTLIKAFDHHCCWLHVWPDILHRVQDHH